MIGIDLGGTKIEAVMLGGDGSPRWRHRVPTPAGDYQATVAAVVSLVARAEAELGLAGGTVGIGTPGSAGEDGLIKNANSTCLNGRPLQHDLEAALGRPVAVANDANCLALSEATDGAGRGAGVVFAVILGTGVGAGIVVDGRVLRGPNGLAGEWGHNPLPWRRDDEPAMPCYCGQRGCIETELNGAALSRHHAATTGIDMDAAAIAAGAITDMACAAACAASIDRYADRLARALASVVNLLDPDVIVLGGGLSNIESLYAEVPRRWGRHVFTTSHRNDVRTRLVRNLHGDSSGVFGAAWLGAGHRS